MARASSSSAISLRGKSRNRQLNFASLRVTGMPVTRGSYAIDRVGQTILGPIGEQ